MKAGFLQLHPPWRPRTFSSPEELWSLFEKYAEQVSKTPVVEPKIFSTKNGIVGGNLDKPRAFTLGSFCMYIGITTPTWKKYKESGDEILEGVMEYIEEAIREHQIGGALTGIFNSTVACRILGLAEKQEVDANVTSSAADEVPERLLAIHIHPDDPDPLAGDRPLYSRAQIESGVPFQPPVDSSDSHVDEDEES